MTMCHSCDRPATYVVALPTAGTAEYISVRLCIKHAEQRISAWLTPDGNERMLQNRINVLRVARLYTSARFGDVMHGLGSNNA